MIRLLSFIKIPTVLLSAVWAFWACPLAAQTDSAKAEPPTEWFRRIQIRGYVQSRYNRLLETNPDLRCEQCDRSWGAGGGFSLRRVRVIFFGQISKRVYFYIQPDFASSASATGLNFGQLRDAYFDVGIDAKNRFRFRIGQSKLPYGFENMQSSQNRIPLDRNDALNSAASNERDIGLFFYWAPQAKRELFARLVADGLKGSGDYGALALGVYNGQTPNNLELNDNLHIVARATWPFAVGSQILEASVQGYTGQYTIAKERISEGTKARADRTYTDQRLAGSFVLYPRPIGLTVEYNLGRGPEYNPQTDSIETRPLHGGYALLFYRRQIKKHTLIAYFRHQQYWGGKKHETDARSYVVNEQEIGVEWSPFKTFELVVCYIFSRRRFEDGANPDNFQTGRLLRFQAQLNF